MYGTPNGERVLAGAEARLFRYGLQQLVDEGLVRSTHAATLGRIDAATLRWPRAG